MEKLKIIAHQFRTPIQTIDGLLSLLLEDEINQASKKKLEIIEECNNQLSAIIDNIINYSTKNESINNTVNVNNVFEIENAIKKCIYINSSNPNKNAIVLKNEINKPLKLYGKDMLFKQFLNLVLNNMCSYTINGEIELIAELGRKEKSVLYISFSFIDSQTGTDVNKKNLLYNTELFNISKDDAYLNFNVITLKKLILNLNGTITTDLDKPFNILSFEIPFNLYTSKLAAKNPRKFKKNNKNILVVEDNIVNQLLLKQLIIKQGFYCETANNGKEAIEKCNILEFDIVLMDLMMPIMDGFESAHIIKEKFRNIKIIAVSAITDTTDVKKLRSYGFDSFLKKPIQRIKLLTEIEKVSKL